MRSVFAIVPVMFLLVCATAGAAGTAQQLADKARASAVREYRKGEADLAAKAFHGDSVEVFCEARRDVVASLIQLSRQVRFQSQGYEQEKTNAANDLERLREYCDEIAQNDALSGEKLTDEPVAKRAREIIVDLDRRTDTIVWASQTQAQVPAR